MTGFEIFPLLGLVALVLGGFLAFKLLQGLLWVLKWVFQGIGHVLMHVLGFVRNVLVDSLHLVGALLTAFAILPLALVNLMIGRLAASRHYLRAVEDELMSALLGLYRIALGHPLRLLCLGPLLDGFERRLPEIVDRAPSTARRRSGDRQFDGYKLFGTLPAGGSGAQLYLARPDADKRARLREAGHSVPEEVVIKAFALGAGSTLPQIVRENQALKAASKLGLVLEHELSADRFYYVMRYVRGEELDERIQHLHAQAGPRGLNDRQLAHVIGYGEDLLHTLDRFHGEGLWHKDVKPSNLIVADDHVHLVDLGLVTPLRADITLTTHGTEYYRDPEMVRLALQGVKVHEVDGAKFDIYSSGAVLYSMVEDSFPAHGSLSKINKRCPEALRWIIRRSMTDMHARYGTAREMLEDLTALAAAPDAFELRPADLPSFGREGAARAAEPRPGTFEASGPRPRPLHASTVDAPRLDDLEARATTPRRRRRRRVLVSVVALLILFGVLGNLAEQAEIRRREARYDHDVARQVARHIPGRSHAQERKSLSAQVFERLPEDDRRVLALAEKLLGDPAFERIRGPRSVELTSSVSPQAQPSRSLSESRARQATLSGRVLVLNDHLAPTGEEILAGLEESLDELGFDILGTSAEPSEGEIDLESRARHAVGMSHPDDAEAVAQLQGFLDRSRELDAIVWLAPYDEKAGPTYHLLVRSDLKAASDDT